MVLKDNYFSLSDLAVMKGFSTAHLRRMILSGKLLAEKVGKRWIVNKKEANKIQRQRASNKQKDI